MIISTDAQKEFDKVQIPLWWKPQKKVGLEGSI